jgi:hypothetical protein
MQQHLFLLHARNISLYSFRHTTVFLASKNSQCSCQLTDTLNILTALPSTRHASSLAIRVTLAVRSKTTKAGTTSCGGQQSEEKRELPRGNITIVRIPHIHHHQLPKTRSKCTAVLAIPVCRLHLCFQLRLHCKYVLTPCYTKPRLLNVHRVLYRGPSLLYMGPSPGLYFLQDCRTTLINLCTVLHIYS